MPLFVLASLFTRYVASSDSVLRRKNGEMYKKEGKKKDIHCCRKKFSFLCRKRDIVDGNEAECKNKNVSFCSNLRSYLSLSLFLSLIRLSRIKRKHTLTKIHNTKERNLNSMRNGGRKCARIAVKTLRKNTKRADLGRRGRLRHRESTRRFEKLR